MKTRIILLLLLLSVSASMMYGQYKSDVSKRGTTAAPFLNISQGARASSMGSAFVAMGDDPSTIFWNAAGLARLGQHGVVVDHTNWIADIGYDFVGASFSLGDFGAIGTSFLMSSVDEMDVTTVDEPEGTGETFGVTQVAFSLAWAYNITENFSIGFNPKVVHESYWKMSATGFAIDMGVLYNTPFPGITLGMSINNFGTKMKLDGTSGVVLYDPDEQNGGNNEGIPSRLQMDEWDLPLMFRVGISYEAFNTEMHRLLLAVDALHPNDDYESLNIGGEYSFLGRFALRAGYKSLFLDDAEESLTLGAGIKQLLLGNVSIHIDYAYMSFGRLSDMQKISVGINF